MADDPKKPELDEDSHSFSAALLAPITSLFEAQVHSARSFLSFLLQMSFGHKPVPGYDDDGDGIPNEEDTDNSTPASTGQMWTQEFPFTDSQGNKQTISIPNIALLPIRPLAVEDASFEFDWEVRTSSEEYTVLKEETVSKKKRPWFLIKEPKRLKGNFTQKGTHESGSRTAISVKVNVGTSTMPYGLERLLTHFTNDINMVQPDGADQQNATNASSEGTSSTEDNPDNANE